MRGVSIVFAFLAVVCTLWAVIASIGMGAWLSRHGVKVNWLLFRLWMPWYVHRYQKMTREIEGRTGPLFPQFVVPINLALLFAVAALVALSAARG
jgi:hypothetical protein